MKIRKDDLTGAEVIGLLEEHLRCMAAVSPAKARHALDLGKLRQPEITFWSIWDGNNLAGCGALKELDAQHGEIKSMRTAYAYQRKGVASQILQHIITVARQRGYGRLSLETGAVSYFDPVRKLYARFGFTPCGPFGSYAENPANTFMTREL